METINYSEFRRNLAGLIDKVNDDHSTVLVTRQNGKPAVLISLEDYQAFEETAYLLSNPANADILVESLSQANQGQTTERGLISEDILDKPGLG